MDKKIIDKFLYSFNYRETGTVHLMYFKGYMDALIDTGYVTKLELEKLMKDFQRENRF